MTITNGYCTLADVRNPDPSKSRYHGGEADGLIEEEITAASRDIDAFCRDQFFQETETAKTFSGTGRDAIPVSPFLALMSTVEYCSAIDEDGAKTWTVIELSELETDGTEIKFVGSDADVSTIRWSGNSRVVGTVRSQFPDGRKNIRVTGTWGRASVPEAIKRAAIYRAIELLNGEIDLAKSRRTGALSMAAPHRLHTMSGGVVG